MASLDRPAKRSRLKEEQHIVDSTAAKAVDAGAFLFRSPTSQDEINAIAIKIRSRIDAAHKKILEIGYEAYREEINAPSSASSLNVNRKGENCGENESDDNFDEDINTDDEIDEGMIEKQKSLEEAVVRGNPRRYQTALVATACRQNTIIHLATGSGKTLIALLVIRHFASAYRDGKVGYIQVLFRFCELFFLQVFAYSFIANIIFGTKCSTCTTTYYHPRSKLTIFCSNCLSYNNENDRC